MKIALCQINPTVGAFKDNKNLILSNYREAVKHGAELVVFPEMVITGYPIADLLYEDGFVRENMAILAEITSQATIPLVVGHVHGENGHLYNSAALCVDGKQLFRYDKILLPTYDVFDEDRYFTAGSELGICKVDIGGQEVKLGLQICEDLWDEDYDRKVTAELQQAGAAFVVNISASPYHLLRLKERLRFIQNKAQSTGLPFFYCNLVGAQDELIFDGQSLAVNDTGELIGLGAIFSEDIIHIDTDAERKISLPADNREGELYSGLVLGVRDYFKKTGHKEAVIGLSGGIDSSLVACIATDALGKEHVHGVSMPSRFSSDHSKVDAQQLAENLGFDFRSITIQGIVSEYDHALGPHFDGSESNVAEENVQARTRGNLLMALSNKFNWLVLSTGNKTEMALGYCTLYGDMSGGLAVISDLSKTDVYALANWVNNVAGQDRIPANCIEKPPSAELAPEQVDPFDYDIVSPLVDRIIENRESPAALIKDGVDPDLVHDIYRRITINEYKRRQAAPGLRVSSKAFGLGRRIPIVNHFMGRRS
jgi:NAD+ synthase (glutamine-hydrolysing)